MAKLNQNIILFKDRFRVIQFTAEGVETLSGFRAYWAVAADAGETALLSKSTEGGSPDIVFDGVKVLITIHPGDFSAQEPGDYYHELLFFDAGDNPVQAAIGKIDLRAVTIASV